MHSLPGFLGQMLDQTFNHGNLFIVDEWIASDAVNHIPGWGLTPNRLGFKQMIANLRAAFPNLQCTVEDEIGQGDKLAAHWTVRGTHEGRFYGNLPTGRTVEVQGFIFARTAAGQIVENWIFLDQMGMLQQLGIVPPPRRS